MSEEMEDAKVDYTAENFKRTEAVQDLGRETSSLYHNFGYDLTRKNNLCLIEDGTVIYAMGNNVVFESTSDGSRKYLLGLDDGGVGCVAVHPNRKMFAVGGRGFQPKIYIYSYPELKIVNVLSGGAERGYSNLSYNAHGDKLASVAMAPDYMLTVWDWERELIELHSKAFGQDVFNVKFSKDDDRRLTTSGTGHIRFWKMASTFTGLKLQGSIGKFGKVELSDVCALDEMPDGKVVSGTESGALLLWEGNFIKCRFVQVGGNKCHEGEITYIELDRKEKCLITAAADGYIRWWDFEAIDTAEVDADITLDFELLPVAEYKLKEGTKVNQMVDCGTNGSQRVFVIHDANGSSQTVTFNLESEASKVSQTVAALATSEGGADSAVLAPETKVLSEFHAGSINGLVTVPGAHIAVTAGQDGSLRCWNYVTRECVGSRKYEVPVTSVALLPKALNNELDPDAVNVIAGFEDGVVRVLCVGKDDKNPEGLSLRSRYVFKPHSAAVLELAFTEGTGAEAAAYVATASKDGTSFILKTKRLPPQKTEGFSWTPIRFLHMVPGSTAKVPVCAEALAFRADAKALLLTCSDGALREVDLSSLASLDTEVESYEAEFPMKVLHGRVPRLSSAATASNARLPGGGPAAAKALEKDGGDGEAKEGGGEGGEGDESAPAAPVKEEDKKQEDEPVSYEPVKVDSACYTISPADASGAPSQAMPGQALYKLYAGVTSQSNRSYLLEFDAMLGEASPDQPAAATAPEAVAADNEQPEGGDGEGKDGEAESKAEAEPEVEVDPNRALKFGVYSPDGRHHTLKTPRTASLRYSQTGAYLLCGTDDGAVVLRPRAQDVTFMRMPAHNGRVTYAATSYDDKFVVSCGVDGVIAVHSLDKDLIEKRAEPLARDIEAGVYPEDQVLKKEKKGDKKDSAAAEGEQKPALLDTDAVEVSPRSTAPAELPKAPEDAPDLDAGAYNIQDAKLKSELDAKLLIAEEVKEKVKVQIKGLQRELEMLLKDNDALPEEVRLTAEQITIDTEYFSQLRAAGEAALSEVHKECEYEAEKALRLRDKITERMLSGLLVPEITLMSFDYHNGAVSAGNRSFVRSVRTRGLGEEVIRLIERSHKEIKDSVLKESQRALGEDDSTVSSAAAAKVTSLASMVAEAGKPKGQEEVSDDQPASAAARRELRQARKKTIAEHKKEEPKDNQDDPRDVAAINEAERTIGDYKLKTSPDYHVPEDQHTDAAKKKLQMCLLEDSLVKMRLAYNERFLGLRDLKKVMIYAIRRSNTRIREIDGELGCPEDSTALWEPSIDPSEYPDEREAVLPEELDAYITLRAEHKDWLSTPAVSNKSISAVEQGVPKNEGGDEYLTAAPPVPKGSLDLNLNLADPEAPDAAAAAYPQGGSRPFEVDDNPMSKFISSAAAAGADDTDSQQALRGMYRLLPSLGNIFSAKKALLGSEPASDAQAAELARHKAERTQKLRFERQKLLAMVDENVAAFKDAVDQMRADRHALLADIKLAELKLMNLYQEFIILLNFETQDNQLLAKQTKSRKDSLAIQQEVASLETLLEQLQAEKAEYTEKLEAIAAEYEESLSENHPYYDQLRKIYKKKARRNPVDEGDDDEEEDDEEEEEDEEEEDLDDVDDACPPGCDPIIHEKLLDLREQRMDNDDAEKALDKKCNETKRAMDKANNRLKQVTKDVNQTAIAIKAFQSEKQAALNKVEVNVPLSVEQIYLFQLSGAFTGPDQLEAAAAEEGGEMTGKLDATTATAATATATGAGAGADTQEGGEPEEEQVDLTLLTDPSKRTLSTKGVVDGKAGFVLMEVDALARLKGRIEGLKRETADARQLYQELKKERVVLSKNRDVQQDKITNWRGKCRDLQMLKFGREIDLDDLEAASNRSREKEAEKALQSQERKNEEVVLKLVKEGEVLREELARITLDNTELLAVVGDLTEHRLQITRDLNASGKQVSTESKDEGAREREERQKVIAYVQLQAREIEALRAELIMLKRKEAPQLSQNMLQNQPPVPGRGGGSQVSLMEGSQVAGEGLPPIPGAKPL